MENYEPGVYTERVLSKSFYLPLDTTGAGTFVFLDRVRIRIN
jgi:hypothetical protein